MIQKYKKFIQQYIDVRARVYRSFVTYRPCLKTSTAPASAAAYAEVGAYLPPHTARIDPYLLVTRFFFLYLCLTSLRLVLR